MVKKKKKINPIADVQEPEGIEISENLVEDTEKSVTENIEKTEEEAESTMAMVYCKNCKKEVDPYSTEKGWKCPACNKFVQSPDIKGRESLREVKASKDRPYELMSSRNIKFSGNEQAQAEMLIQAGVAKDFHDLAKKALNLLFIKEKLSKAFGGMDNTMELNKEPNPERTMKEIQQQEMMKAYIEGMRKGNQVDPMQMMMMMRQMENQDKGKSSSDNGFMNQLAMVQMMQTMMKPQGDSDLQKEIADLKHQMQMQQMMNQQAQMQQGNQSSQQFMQQMEQIRAERDKSIKEADIAAQQERDKNLQLAFDNRRIELENRLKAIEKDKKETGSGQLAIQRIKQLKEEIGAIKEMSHVLGNKEKGAGEYISETVTNVATQLQPAITKLIDQREQQRVMQQQMQQLPPEPVPVIEQPQNPGSVTESGIPVDTGQPSDMTETEQQISDQMSSMYKITPEKKVK